MLHALLPLRGLRPLAALAAVALLAVLAMVPARAQATTVLPIRLATSPAIEQSGLLVPLLAKFKQTNPVFVHVLPVAMPRLIDLARLGEADVLLVLDDKGADDKTLQALASRRSPVMRNEFRLIGPKADPAGAKGKDLLEALRKIDSTRSLFISRGDQGIVHQAEQRLWQQAGMKAGKGGGHRECKCGTGGVLDIAATAHGYALADSGSWAAFRNRGELASLVEGDARLEQGYSVLVVNAERFHQAATSSARAEQSLRHRNAQAFAQWLGSPAAQAVIAAHRVGGQPFFLPRAGK